MKSFFSLCMVGLVAAGMQAVEAADLKSGLQVDEFPAAFYVTDITGPSADRKLCYRCQYGARPVVSIFVREMNENTTKLIKDIDTVVGKNSGNKMAAFVTVLSDDPDQQEAALKKAAKSSEIVHTPLTVFENNVGPTKYKINPKADVTVMMWVDSNVRVNHALTADELNADAIGKIVADTSKILN